MSAIAESSAAEIYSCSAIGAGSAGLDDRLLDLLAGNGATGRSDADLRLGGN